MMSHAEATAYLLANPLSVVYLQTVDATGTYHGESACWIAARTLVTGHPTEPRGTIEAPVDGKYRAPTADDEQ